MLSSDPLPADWRDRCRDCGHHIDGHDRRAEDGSCEVCDDYSQTGQYAPCATVRRLGFLILTMPEREIVSVSLREGIDFLDDLTADFGDFYILETA